MRVRASKGDADFTAFMSQAGPSLLRTAWLLTGDHHEAQELTQAALVKAYLAWPRIREGEALAYTRRILVNHRTDVWRGSRKETTTETLPERGPNRAPGDSTGAADDRDLVVRLLRSLPQLQRKVVVLRYYADLSERATADALGISVGAVKSAASRGLAALRAELATEPARPDPVVDEHSEEGSMR